MVKLKGTLVAAMADISRVKAEEKSIAKAEKKEIKNSQEEIDIKCDLYKSIFPHGYVAVKKKYSKLSYFSDPALLKYRLSQSAASMATFEIKILHPEMLEFEARQLMQAECGSFKDGVFVFDIEKASNYLNQSRRGEAEPIVSIHEDSKLKGSIVTSSKKRIDWRKQEREAVKRMLEELSLQREKRFSKKIHSTIISDSVHSLTKKIEKNKLVKSAIIEYKKESETLHENNISDIKYKSSTEEILLLLQKNKIHYLYHFTSIKNIPSIKKQGGLYSWNYMEKNGINIPAPGGDTTSRNLDVKYNLQDYVRLSFCKDHPMAHRLRVAGENIVLLVIDIRAAAFAESLYSDMNATDSRHHHGAEIADLEKVDFNAVKRTYVSSSDPDFKSHQAEVMIKKHIPSEFILNLDDF